MKIQDALYYYITDRADSQSNIQQVDHFLDVVIMLENVETELKTRYLRRIKRSTCVPIYRTSNLSFSFTKSDLHYE